MFIVLHNGGFRVLNLAIATELGVTINVLKDRQKEQEHEAAPKAFYAHNE